MAICLLCHALAVQSDVMGSRQRARQISQLLGFDENEQTRIATSVSELARNAFRYAGGGKVDFDLEGQSPPQTLVVHVSDNGPGIENLQEILDGTYRSTTGMGIGLIGSRRLMDRWEIQTSERGTKVTIGKRLPDAAPVITALTAQRLLARISAMPATTSVSEVQSQNAELLRALTELQEKQEKLVEMAHELEDTNRGVVALYAELDEKAAHLRRADELKTRFLSNMSHEFRTPLNSMRALCSLLLSHADGPLQPEQEKQVGFIAKGAIDLSELVNDLLDLAKIEAGKIDVRPGLIEVVELFSALRGMLRPLSVSDSVELVFEDPVGVPTMYTDESKLSQIVRNFVSNALKFTERGTVTVRAYLADEGGDVVFSVSDTGIGIAMEDIELIFEEFAQIASPLQRRVKGTGLGLPLCRRLAKLLGGDVSVESDPGRGSTFYARLPAHLPEAPVVTGSAGPAIGAQSDGPSGPQFDAAKSDARLVLIIDDDDAARYVIRRTLRGPLRFEEARDGASGLAMAGRLQPAVIFLDLSMPGLLGDEVLDRLKADPATAHIPVIIVTSHDLEAGLRARLGAQAAAIVHKKDLSAESLAGAMAAIGKAG